MGRDGFILECKYDGQLRVCKIMAKLKEQKSWENFVDSTDSRFLKFRRFENSASEGMPDVIGQNRKGTMFWIENKALLSWPKRKNTKPLRTAFEPGQIPFMKEWIGWGGFAYVLLRVQDDYLLLRPKFDIGVPDLVDQNSDELITYALAGGKEEIINYLEML